MNLSIRLLTIFRSLTQQALVHQSVTCFQNSLCIFYRYLCNGKRTNRYENDNSNDNSDDNNNDADDVYDDNNDIYDEDDDDNNDYE